MTGRRDPVTLLKDLVRIDTSNPPGNEWRAVEYLAALFREEGVAFEVVAPEKGRESIVAWIGPVDRSPKEAPPVVLISHLDVVVADPSEWHDPPFAAVEREGVIYGRGTLDTKYLTAMEATAFLSLKGEPLTRPVYFIASADEEQGSTVGMPHVVERWGERLRGATVINEGGGFFIAENDRPYYLCTVGEKGRCRCHVTIEGAAGPASFPCADRAMEKLLALLDRLDEEPFAPEENVVSARFDDALGETITQPLLRAFREYNRRDTFILKRYDAGHAVNAQPHRIAFDIELQLLPSRDRRYAEGVFARVFEGLDIVWEITDFRAGFASSIGEAYASLERSIARHVPGSRLVPVYALGQTDGRFLGGLPADVYGFAPVTPEIPFTEVLTLVHQPNEKITRRSVEIGAEVVERLIRDVALAAAD